MVPDDPHPQRRRRRRREVREDQVPFHGMDPHVPQLGRRVDRLSPNARRTVVRGHHRRWTNARHAVCRWHVVAVRPNLGRAQLQVVIDRSQIRKCSITFPTALQSVVNLRDCRSSHVGRPRWDPSNWQGRQ